MMAICTSSFGLRAWQTACLLFLLLLGTGASWAQTPTPGLIFKSATTGTPGAAVLDPNGDGYVSATVTGFSGGTDLGAASELPYRYLPQIVSPREPMADLRVGPSTKFTDFADHAFPNGGNSVGFYVDGNNNFMFRFRLGGAAPNSKGYSIALDTDGKFGFSGPDADPNAVVGNPGFEMEILLASNFGVRLYNLDGTATPSDAGLVAGGGPDGSMVQLVYESYAHKAIAATNNDGTVDVFYDFYIPLSVIQAEFGSRTYFGTSGASTPFSLSTPLRMVANTIIAPHSVTKYQNISDICGLANVPNTDAGFISLIAGSTPTSGGSLPPGNNILARTAPPVVSSPLQQGTTTVSGTSTEAAGTVITVHVNGTALGPTTTVLADGTWTLTGISPLAVGALIKATALAPTKSISNFSNEVRVGGTPACATAIPTITCSTDRSIRGTATPGTTMYLRYPSGALVGITDRAKNLDANPVVADATGVFFFTSGGGNATCDNGQPNALQGTYLVSQTAPSTTCESKPAIVCVNAVATATPVVTTAKPLTTSSTSIAGTAVSGAIMTLEVDGNAFSSVTATGGNFTFAGGNLPTLASGRVLTIMATANATTCVSAKVTLNVMTTARTVIAPVVNGPLYPGATTVTGTSVEAPNSVITVTLFTGLNATGTPTVQVTTATVQANGSWSLTVPALGSNSSVRATVTPVDYSISGPSNVVNVAPRTTFVPTITGTYTEGNTAVSGTVPVNTPTSTVLIIYLDGTPLTAADGVTPLTVTTTTTSPTTTTPWTLTGLVSSPFPALCAGGVLTATATAPSQAEGVFSNQVPVGCVTFQNRTLNTTAVCVGNTATITVANVEPGVIYTLQDVTSGSNLAASKLGPGTGTSSLSFTTAPYNTASTYSLRLNAFSLGAIECSATASTVSLMVNPLPLTRTVAPQQTSPVTTYQAARTGTNVQVQSSEVGVSYQLVNTSVLPNAIVGAPQTGTGSTLNLPTGPLDTSTATNRPTTNYAVVGTSTTAPTNCVQQVGTAAVTYSGPLPVELTIFEAVASRGDAVLTWGTASEKNNDHFAVERSANGREFAAIGEVAGQGTATQAHAYTFRDVGAARLGQLVYYRLRQVDRDGTVGFSPVRPVKFTGIEAPAAVLLYPNPTTTDVMCSLALLPAGTYSVQVLNVTGQVLSTTQLATDQPRGLPVADLPAGLYLVHVQGPRVSLTQRLVKVR